MAKIITDNLAYTKIIKEMGNFKFIVFRLLRNH